MFEVLVTHGNQHKRLEVPDDTIVGRAADSEVRLDSWRVGKEHARLYRTPSGPAIEDLGAMHGLQVNGQRTALHGPLKPEDRIEIGPFVLQVRDLQAAVAKPASVASLGAADTKPTSPRPAEPAKPAKEPAKVVPITEATSVSPDTAQRLRLAELEYTWRTRVHERLLELLDLRRKDVSRMSDERLREEVDGLVRDVIAELKPQLPPELDLQVLRKQAINEAVGLGPLEDLLADESVTEIMVNKHDEVYIERAGRLLRHSVCFTSDRAVLGVIERIVAPLGRRIDESSPMVDARLKDGSRVNAIIPPVALKGPTITIRKFAQRKLTCDDLVGFDAISPQMAEFLQVCVQARKNIVVSGGTGSGKTTLLNILANFIPDGERVLTVEDAAELRLNHSHVVSLEARPSNAEGRGAVTIRDLVRNGLRMRPDRIVVGECRGAEALDMLQAMNTGHEGSLTTLHANTPRDALARLETLVLMAGMDLPLVAIREQIASAVDVIVQQARFSCGSRKVTRIVEITGIEQGKLQLQDIFLYEQQGYGANGRVAGRFRGCELVPSFYEALAEAGRPVDLELFKAQA